MNEAQLRQQLGPRPLRYFPTVGSTNQAATDWLAEQPDLSSGAVVIANEQSAGRGRLGRGWLTPPGTAIAMTVLLRDLPSPARATMLGAVAVAESLEPFAPVTLKWANDVQVAGKKLCGILAEALWQGDEAPVIILGIGINLTVDFRGTPLAAQALSLADVSSQPIDRVALIGAILDRLTHWTAAGTGPYADLPLYHAWKRRLHTLGQAVTVYTPQETLQGRALDVDEQGALLVTLDSGETRRFMAGDVSLRTREADPPDPPAPSA